VVVTQVDPGSVAASAGIRPGVLIQEINHKRISNSNEFRKAIEKTPKNGIVLMLIKDGDSSRYVTLKVE